MISFCYCAIEAALNQEALCDDFLFTDRMVVTAVIKIYFHGSQRFMTEKRAEVEMLSFF